MEYLNGQILFCVLIAGLLGLAIGWLLWGVVLRQALARAAQLKEHVSELSGLPAKLADLEETYSALIVTRTEEAAMFKARIAELERSNMPKGEPLKAKAAAASVGFYNPAGAAVPSPPPNQVRDFEKRIAELRDIEASKDREISRLRGRLKAIEDQSDSEGRRQILLAEKTAEVSRLRIVLDSLFEPLKHADIAVRAYLYAEERHFQGGSPNEDWLRAERDLHFGRLALAWENSRNGKTL